MKRASIIDAGLAPAARALALMTVLALMTMLALMTLLAPGTARAQSCCGVAAEDELSVAGWERRAVLTAKLGLTHMLGRHDSRGRYSALPDGMAATDAQLVLGAGVRMPFYEALQVHGSFPMRLQYRAVPSASGEETSATAVGAGDAALFVRWSALRDDELGLFDARGTAVPSLDLYVGGKAPTARFDDGPSAREQARTMGPSTFAVIAGARAIKHLTPEHALRLSARYELHGDREVDDATLAYESFHPGDIIGITAGYLGLSGMHWAFGATLDLTLTTAASARAAGEGFRAVPSSAQRAFTIGAHVTRTISMPDLDLTLGVTYAPPLDQLSSNTALEGVTAGLTLRWHWLRSDAPHGMHHPPALR